MEKRKLLTLDNLYNFYLNQNKTCSFSAKNSGYQISVQIPTQFEISEETKDDTLLFCTVKLMHSGENRNHSCVTDDALYKAGKNLAYKPILANFMEYVDESTGETLKDFTSHDMEINDDGTVTYLEKQIGCFTADEPYYEIEKETGHNFLYGKCAIPVEYSDAYSIIKRKNGTKVSAELIVNEMQYNANSKVLELTDVIIQGATCLGKDPDTLEDFGEGMLNARLDIADFSVDNNSLFAKYENQMIEFQERLEKLESTCSNIQLSKEGGNDKNMDKFNELLEKYGKTVEDIDFEYEDMTDSELEVKFEEVFGKLEENSTSEPSNDEGVDEGDETDDNPEVKEENACGGTKKKKKKCEEESDDEPKGDDSEDNEADPEIKEDNACGSGSGSRKKKKKNDLENPPMERTYEISHDDIRYALYNLLSSYEESDNECYYITGVYDSYFVYESWNGGKIYGQKYTTNNDNVAFDGERYVLHKEYLTDSEYAELQSMRSNYSSLKEFKETTEKNELHAQREEILYSEKYSVISEKNSDGVYANEAFAKLVSEMDKYSLADLEKEAKVILADFVTSNQTFAVDSKPDKPSIQKKIFANPESKATKKSRYGNLFSKK